MRFEEEIFVATDARRIFALYVDVNGWSIWDPEVRAASINGQFVAGSTGTLRPKQGPPVKITFTSVEPNRSFTVESKLFFCVMRFEHELSEGPEHTKVVHRVVFSGPLAPIFGRLIGSGIRKGLPRTLRGLKAEAERETLDFRIQ